MIIRLWSCL